MPRPFRMRTPKVSKKPGPTVFTCSTPSSGDANVTPGMEKPFPSSFELSGGMVAKVACCTPGQGPEPLQDLAMNLAQALSLERRSHPRRPSP